MALPKFQESVQLVDERGMPTVTFHIWWNDFADNLQSALDNLTQAQTDLASVVADLAAAVADIQTLQTQMQDRIDDITAIQADLTAQLAQIVAAQNAADAAQTTADTAQTTATTASTTANTVKRDDSISTSWTSPGSILDASDAGTSATITISNHTRKYTDVTSKSVTGGTITGLAYSTTYTVYYDQIARTGGVVTYHATTDPNVGLANAAAGRHYCGKITTPAAGGTSTSGGVTPPSGGGGWTAPGDIP